MIGHFPAVTLELEVNRIRELVRIDPQGLGREVWIADGDRYCGKILEICKGKKCSLHFHKLKDESFYLHAEDGSRSGSRNRPRPPRWRSSS